MLNLLAWIVFMFKDVWWHGKNDKVTENQKNDVVDGKEIECSGKEKPVIKEEHNESRISNEESSLDDILNDTSWKAVDGSLQGDQLIKIEQTEGFFIVSEQPDGNDDISSDSSVVNTKASKKVQRIKSFTESFGEIADGDNVKSALIIKRADSLKRIEKDKANIKKEGTKSGEFVSEPVYEAKDSYTVSSGYNNEFFLYEGGYGGETWSENDISRLRSYDDEREQVLSDSEEATKIFKGDDNVRLRGGVHSGGDELEARGVNGVSRYTSSKDITLKKKTEKGLDISSENVKVTIKIEEGSSSKSIDRKEQEYIATCGEKVARPERSDSWDSIEVRQTNHKNFAVAKNVADNRTIEDSLKANDKSSTPNKLKFSREKSQAQSLNDSPKADLQEFDIIMRKRKLHTDTMQKVSDTFGNLGHREDKIYGPTDGKNISRRWKMIQQALKNKRYLKFDQK